jgi:hypothetical protein
VQLCFALEVDLLEDDGLLTLVGREIGLCLHNDDGLIFYP